METLTRKQVIDRMKRFAMHNFNILYANKGRFIIKDFDQETTEAFFTKFNSLNTQYNCWHIANGVDGAVYEIDYGNYQD